LAGYRQSHCKNYQAYFFAPPCTLNLRQSVYLFNSYKYSSLDVIALVHDDILFENIFVIVLR